MGFRDLARCGCIMLVVYLVASVVVGLTAYWWLGALVGVAAVLVGADSQQAMGWYEWGFSLAICAPVAITFLVLAGLEVRKTHRRLNE